MYQPLLLIEYKIQKTIDGFREKDLFNTFFTNYAIFSITTTNSKKIHGSGMRGFLKRNYYKYFAKHWVLSGFTPEKHYSIFIWCRRGINITSVLCHS
jgi:hypothetical protein